MTTYSKIALLNLKKKDIMKITPLILILAAKSFKDTLNDILSNYGLPLLGFVMILGISVGLARNWSKINADDWGTKKEGLFNLLITVAYVFLAISILTVAVTAIGAIDLKI